MKARILQLVIILVLFVLGVALFSGGSSPEGGAGSEYVPPAP